MLLTRLPLSNIAILTFDLHVLSTPPAFILSQDQTLRKYTSIQITLSCNLIRFVCLRFLTTLQLLMYFSLLTGGEVYSSFFFLSIFKSSCLHLLYSGSVSVFTSRFSGNVRSVSLLSIDRSGSITVIPCLVNFEIFLFALNFLSVYKFDFLVMCSQFHHLRLTGAGV